MRSSISLFGLLLLAGTLAASDLVREGRMAGEIEDAILVGQPIRLRAGEVDFLAIHSEAAAEPLLGGVIILHGQGAHPDWTDVIQPLRSELPEYGWETLSLQMPVASAEAPQGAYEALIPESFPRIAAGVAFLRQRQIDNIVLVGHSLGARMGAEYLAAGAPKEITSFAAVGLSARREAPDKGTLGALAGIKIPILDIYGSRDLEAVLTTVDLRAAAARRAGNRGYRQLEVPGADHFFNGLEDVLVARVRAWLKGATAALSAESQSPPAGH